MLEDNPGGVRFAEIQAILNDLVKGVDRTALKAVHGDDNFGWETREQLRSVAIRPEGPDGQVYQLIDMDLVQQKRGDETYLVKALRNPTGINPYGRMPRSPPGRYANPQEIQKIIDWLNSGMPE